MSELPPDIEEIVQEYLGALRVREGKLDILCERYLDDTDDNPEEGLEKIQVGTYNAPSGLWYAKYAPFHYEVDRTYIPLIIHHAGADLSRLPPFIVPKSIWGEENTIDDVLNIGLISSTGTRNQRCTGILIDTAGIDQMRLHAQTFTALEGKAIILILTRDGVVENIVRRKVSEYMADERERKYGIKLSSLFPGAVVYFSGSAVIEGITSNEPEDLRYLPAFNITRFNRAVVHRKNHEVWYIPSFIDREGRKILEGGTVHIKEGPLYQLMIQSGQPEKFDRDLYARIMAEVEGRNIGTFDITIMENGTYRVSDRR